MKVQSSPQDLPLSDELGLRLPRLDKKVLNAVGVLSGRVSPLEST